MWQYKHTNELYHHGILGMKWGVRRFQNKDGSLTEEGRKRFTNSIDHYKKKHSKKSYEAVANSYAKEKASIEKKGYKQWAKENYLDSYKDSEQQKRFNNYKKTLDREIKSAKLWANESKNLSLKLDSIDPTSVGFKQAMKLTKRYETVWINETLDKEYESNK